MSQSQSESAVELDLTAVHRPVLHHVNLKTRQLQEMIDWYELVIGSTVNFQFTEGAFISNDEANHRLALLSHPELIEDDEKIRRVGMHHTAFEYDSLEQLLATYARLKEKGILPHICLDHGLTMSFYYADPDGNSVELQSDNYGNWKESTEFIRTDPRFAADPVGSLVDPDALVELLRGGVSPKEIHERAYEGEFPPTGPVDPRMPQ
jgi:catechol-2,3-dioxygenase